MTRRAKIFIFALGLPLAAGAGLWAVQAPGPELRPNPWIAEGSDDQTLLAKVADYPDFDAYVRREADRPIMTLPLARGAELLEFARVTSASRYRTLRHQSPVVRAYAALQLLKHHPDRAKALRPLLADAAPLARAEFGEATGTSTVAETVVALLCAVSEEPAVRALLEDVGHDLRHLGAWGSIHACLAADAS